MIFTEQDINELNGKLIAIHPMLSRAVTGVGYDMHIGYFVKVHENKVQESGIHSPDVTRELIMESGSSLFIVSYERFFLSRLIAGTIHSKGSYAAQGLSLNSTTVDPLWRGQMVFLLTNHSPNNVKLDLSKSFGTIVFQRVRTPSSKLPRNPGRVLVKFMQDIADQGGEPAGALDFLAHPQDNFEEEFRQLEKKVASFSSFFPIAKLISLNIWMKRKVISIFGVIAAVWFAIVFEQEILDRFPQISLTADQLDGFMIFWAIVTGIATLWSASMQFLQMREAKKLIMNRAE